MIAVRGLFQTRCLSLHRAHTFSNYDQALSVGRPQSARVLARLWHEQGRRTEARDLPTAIYSGFTEGFDTPAVKNAKAMLDEPT
jgi:hypothetical protein